MRFAAPRISLCCGRNATVVEESKWWPMRTKRIARESAKLWSTLAGLFLGGLHEKDICRGRHAVGLGDCCEFGPGPDRTDFRVQLVELVRQRNHRWQLWRQPDDGVAGDRRLIAGSGWTTFAAFGAAPSRFPSDQSEMIKAVSRLVTIGSSARGAWRRRRGRWHGVSSSTTLQHECPAGIYAGHFLGDPKPRFLTLSAARSGSRSIGCCYLRMRVRRLAMSITR